jgi:adenosine kinase
MIVVTGSLAFDYIMDFPGEFSDHILPDQIHKLSLSFLVDTLKKQRGGVAGNIAHSLALLGERPCIVAAAGEDFESYSTYLSDEGVITDHIAIIPDEYTASAYITTDLVNNQITGFYAGAMNQADQLTLANIDDIELVIIAADNPKAMMNYTKFCQEHNIPYIFDPSQQIVRFTDEEIASGIEGAKILIGNDYEIQMVMNRLGMSEKDLLDHVESLHVTLGKHGSRIHTKDGVLEIPTADADDVIDPTGVGDAYRAGIIKGIINDWPYEKMGRVAALAACYVIEVLGAQEHTYEMEAFKERYAENFGEEIVL